jgi:hypothetical protein
VSPRTLPFDIAAVFLLFGAVALTAFNQREGTAGVLRELLLILAVAMMWVSLRLA